MRSVLLCLALALPFTHAVGCVTSEEDLCDAKCDCEGCSDRDYNNCVNGYEDDYQRSGRFGCDDYYDDWVSCQQDTWVCRGSDFDTSCKPEKDRFKNCIDD